MSPSLKHQMFVLPTAVTAVASCLSCSPCQIHGFSFCQSQFSQISIVPKACQLRLKSPPKKKHDPRCPYQKKGVSHVTKTFFLPLKKNRDNPGCMILERIFPGASKVWHQVLDPFFRETHFMRMMVPGSMP